jgi:broad specificity phosphatase PhoE
MNRVFYIFRHGETDWNKERRCQGHTDIALNDNGISQAKELASRASALSLQVVFSSDLTRARQTGSIVAEHLNVPIFFDSRLREMSYGKAEGMFFQEAIESFGPEVWEKLQSFKKENDHVGFPEGETRLVARLRLENMINEIIQKTDYKIIGISTHGGALRNLLQSLLPEDHPILAIPNCVVYELHYDYANKKFIVNTNPI